MRLTGSDDVDAECLTDRVASVLLQVQFPELVPFSVTSRDAKGPYGIFAFPISSLQQQASSSLEANDTNDQNGTIFLPEIKLLSPARTPETKKTILEDPSASLPIAPPVSSKSNSPPREQRYLTKSQEEAEKAHVMQLLSQIPDISYMLSSKLSISTGDDGDF